MDCDKVISFIDNQDSWEILGNLLNCLYRIGLQNNVAIISYANLRFTWEQDNKY